MRITKERETYRYNKKMRRKEVFNRGLYI